MNKECYSEVTNQSNLHLKMFNATQFYPTPSPLASKMKAYLTEGRSYRTMYPVLDPQAGKGNLLDVFSEKHNLRAIELDLDLQATLKGKGYTIIGSDFLEFNETGCYPSIIMNPPFVNGVDHLLHAWEILSENGRLVCILPSTAVNQSNSKKTRLTNLISQYGSCENLGKAFQDSERTTNVEVVLITLNKPVTKPNFDFDSFKPTVEDFEAAIVPHGAGDTLAKTDIVKTLVHQYELALDCLKQRYQAQIRLEYSLQGINTFSGLGNYEKVDFELPDIAKSSHELKSRFWQTVFTYTELEKRATSDFKKKFTTWEKDQAYMAFNEQNIKSMLAMFWQNKEQINLDSLCYVFDNLTRWSENCITDEGWKTNKSSRLNTKVIIPNIVEFDYGISLAHNWCVDLLGDIDKALCILTGKKIEEITTIQSAIRSHIADIKADPMLGYSGKFESTFFTIKIFKKGTCHIWFKDVKVNEDFNLTVARHRKWLGDGT